MKKLIGSMVFLLLLVSAPVAANAQKGEGDWQFRLGTFLWAADTNLKLETPSVTVDKTIKFEDILEYTEPSINLTFAAKKDKLSIHTNFFNFHAKNDIETSSGVRGVSVDLYIPEAFVGYEALNTNLSDTVSLILEPYAGVRYFSSRMLIDNIGGGEHRDTKRNATDAIAGLMATVGIGEKLSVTLRGDAGGFDLGGDSTDSDYFVMGTLNWNYSKNKTINIGYASLKFGKDNIGPGGDINSEIELKGPILSHTFQF